MNRGGMIPGPVKRLPSEAQPRYPETNIGFAQNGRWKSRRPRFQRPIRVGKCFLIVAGGCAGSTVLAPSYFCDPSGIAYSRELCDPIFLIRVNPCQKLSFFASFRAYCFWSVIPS